jgi:hypothetical protein
MATHYENKDGRSAPIDFHLKPILISWLNLQNSLPDGAFPTQFFSFVIFFSPARQGIWAKMQQYLKEQKLITIYR